jgi:hypothetical protein
MKYKSIYIYIPLIIFGCSNPDKPQTISINENTKISKEFPLVEDKRFNQLFEYVGGTPYEFFEVDTGMYIFDIKAKENKIIHFFSFSEKQIIKSMINKGNGLYESFSPKITNIKNEIMTIHDFSMKKIIELKLNSTESDDSLREIKLPNYFNEVEIINKSSLIGNGSLNSNKKFQIINLSNGEIREEFGDYFNIPENLNTETLKQYFQFTSTTSPDGSKVASGYRWHDQIEIFNLESKKGFAIKLPTLINNLFALQIDASGRYSLERGGEIQHCFMNISSTENYIYGLFSGKKDLEENAFFGSHVYVYDWEGNPIKQINLDRDVMTISISPDDKRLYAFDIDTSEVLFIDL